MKFKHFNEITIADVNSDLHIHSSYTDGQDSIASIVKQAETMNLQTIAITDHIREDSTYFGKCLKEIEVIRTATKINILIGFEARIKNFCGDMDVPKDVCAKADLKIASVHRFSIGKKIFDPNSFSKEIAQELELEISLAGIRNKECNVLGHPGGMCLKYFKEFPMDYYEDIILACNKHKIAFELNSAYHQDIYPDLKNLLRRHNPLIAFGSDAHNISNIGKWSVLLKEEFINAKN